MGIDTFSGTAEIIAAEILLQLSGAKGSVKTVDRQARLKIFLGLNIDDPIQVYHQAILFIGEEELDQPGLTREQLLVVLFTNMNADFSIGFPGFQVIDPVDLARNAKSEI